MCEIMKELIRDNNIEIAKQLIQSGKFSSEEIACIVRLPVDMIEKMLML